VDFVGRLGGGGLSPGEARVLAAHLLSALAHAHAHAVFHLDIKADNVFVGPAAGADGTVDDAAPPVYVLGDWGGAGVTAGGHGPASPPTTAGTPWYRAPEAAWGGALGPCDVYSLGRTLTAVLAGYMSEEGALGAAVAAAGPDPLLRDFLLRMVAWDPADRWTPEDLLQHGFMVAGVSMGGGREGL
jgi:serine/threonine protein kinase